MALSSNVVTSRTLKIKNGGILSRWRRFTLRVVQLVAMHWKEAIHCPRLLLKPMKTRTSRWMKQVLPRCYRYLGPPTFFPHSIFPTAPLPMEHDNQWWRDLLGDLGPVHRWQCFKHHLLKGWVHHFSSFLFSFHFGLICIIISMIMPCTASCHHAYTLVSAWLTHSSLLMIMLTLTCHFCLLS